MEDLKISKDVKMYKRIFVFLISVLILANCSAVTEQETAKIKEAAPDNLIVKTGEKRNLLVFDLCEGFKHSSIPYVNKALQIIGKKTGAYETVISRDMSVFEAENLEKFDAVCFNNTTRLKFENKQYRKNLLEFIKKGKGFVGIHAATDNFYNWPEAAGMIGGQFVNHPWTAGGTWAIKVDVKDHPVTEMLDDSFKLKEEIYYVRQINLKENAKVLLSLDFSDEKTQEAAPEIHDAPISWVRDYGKGRVFYCSIGHNHNHLWNTKILKHYLAGIQFAFGDLKADTTPTVEDLSRIDLLLEKLKSYEYKERALLFDIEEIVRKALSMDREDELEKKFAEFLASDATFAGKQFVCRQLRVMGPEESIEELGNMLLDEENFDIAILALEKTESEKIDKLFLETAKKTKDSIKTAIINSIGNRKIERSISFLKKQAMDEDNRIAHASIAALGKMESRQALDALKDIIDDMNGKRKESALNSILRLAENLQKNDKISTAKKIFAEIYKNKSYSELIRVKAFNGLLKTENSSARELIKNAFLTEAELIKNAAAANFRKVNFDVSGLIKETFANVNSEDKVKLIYALIDRNEKDSVNLVINAVNNENEDVRIAAYKAVGKLGNKKHVKLLAENAAKSTGLEKQQIRNSFYLLSGDEVNDEILSLIDRAEGEVKIELVKAIGTRYMNEGIQKLLEVAQKDNWRVQRESLKVLSDLATPAEIMPVISILKNSDSGIIKREAEKTLLSLALKIENKADRSEKIIGALDKASDTDNKASLLRVTGNLYNNNSLETLYRYLDSGNEKLITVSIRALADWPDSSPLERLYEIASTADNPSKRIIALRGYISKINKATSNPKKKMQLYRRAMLLAQTERDKKMILSAMGKADDYYAMLLCKRYLKEEDVKAEAQLAIVQNADVAVNTHYIQTKKLLEEIIKTGSNQMIIEQAKKVLAETDKFEDYIVSWKVAGPFEKQGLNRGKLLEYEFDIEEQDFESDEFIPIEVGIDERKPWAIDLDKKLGGRDRVAYLKTYIWSPEEQKLLLEFGSDDGSKIWINDEMLFEKNVSRGLTPGEDKIEAEFQKGWNELVVKVSQGGGLWSACARVKNSDGTRAEDIIFSSEKFDI